MSESNTLASLEYSIQAKRRVFSSILDHSCAGLWKQQQENVLERLDALETELSGIEKELDLALSADN